MSRLLLSLLMALALASCATPRVYTDHDPSAQFSSYRTYSWREKPEKAPPLIARRIVDAIDAQLAAKGWQQVPDGGDVALAAHVASRQEYELDTFYNDPFWGGWGWHHHWGVGATWGTTRVRSYTVGTLVLDMFDTRTRQAIWRGTAEGTVSKKPEKVNADIQTAVTKMFANFPPGTVAGR